MKSVKKTLNPDQLRQGDVLLERVDTPLAALQPLPCDPDGSATLAHGEVTGHRHRFAPRFEGDGEAMLYAHPLAPADPVLAKLLAPRALVHEEHTPQEIPAGTVRISRPYEYTGAELRRVED